MTLNNTSLLEDDPLLSPVEQVCSFGSLPFTFLTTITIIFGLAGNIFIVLFSAKELKINPSPYTVFLMNLSGNNLIGMALSLPLFYIDFCTSVLRTQSHDMNAFFVILYLFFQFTCLGIGMYTLAAMCGDRYEAFTKLPGERTLTVRKAKLVCALIWLAIVLSVLLTFTGYFLDIRTVTSFSVKVFKSVPKTTNQVANHYSLIVLVNIWMFSCNFTLGLTIRRVQKEIKQQSSQIQSVLGPQRTKVEINLFKIVVVTIIIYSFLWIPFGVTRGLFSAYQLRYKEIVCSYAMSHQLSYAPFGILPYIYILSDIKARKKFCSVWKICRPSGQVHPSTEESDNIVQNAA